jgi:hypothetical protein
MHAKVELLAEGPTTPVRFKIRTVLRIFYEDRSENETKTYKERRGCGFGGCGGSKRDAETD